MIRQVSFALLGMGYSQKLLDALTVHSLLPRQCDSCFQTKVSFMYIDAAFAGANQPKVQYHLVPFPVYLMY